LNHIIISDCRTLIKAMDKTVQQLKDRLKVLAGLTPADLLLKNVQILDVFTESVFPGSILIKDGRIIALNPDPNTKTKREFDGRGMFALPGFMDTHIHIETTLVTPEALADAIVPWGTTTLFAEVLDFVSVAGVDALKVLLRNRERLPYRIYLTAPGKMVDPAITEQMLAWESTVALGEMLPKGILDLQDEDLEKILSARAKGKVVTGHVPGHSWQTLNMFAAAGLEDDHECLDFEGTVARLRLGISRMIRDGSTVDSVEDVVTGFVKNRLPTDDLMFCSDDIYVNDLLTRGHINASVQKAIHAGLDPIKAIKMATINPAKHFRMAHLLGSLTPGRYADVLLLEKLDEVQPTYVFQGGKLVAEKGEFVPPVEGDHQDLRWSMTQGLGDLAVEDFLFAAEGKRVEMPVLDVNTEHADLRREQMVVRESRVEGDLERDLLKFTKIERYPTNGRQIVRAFVHGFGLKSGALATLFTQGGHSVSVVGVSDEDMYLAAREVDRHPGALVAVANGRVLGVLELPLACTISDLSAHETTARLNHLQDALRELGCDLPSPFMTLWFIPFFLK
jgi:adenine deaminase